MRIRRSATGLIAAALTTGAIATALTVVTPDGTYYDMKGPTVARNIVAVDSTTTSHPSPDGTYYDM
jgi:hypothetical protein